MAVKPLPISLGVCLAAKARRAFPLIVDIDDPDLEHRLHSASRARRIAWRLRHPLFTWRVRNLNASSGCFTTAVSNPVLQEKYGGTLVPHARPDKGPGQPHRSPNPTVAFVGTVRSHKGISVLRESVARLQPDGFRLVITADRPEDANAWESWVGEGSVGEGESLVAAADIIALPSLASSFAEGQLPAKLIDAMMLGRAVVVSKIAPLPWAVGDLDLSVEPGSPTALAAALRDLAAPERRQEIADRLRARALSEFSVTAIAPRLVELLEQAQNVGSEHPDRPRRGVRTARLRRRTQ
ncbi:glycosyltransferase [Microbacterium sp. zg.Y909]|uniref:glycosyltransferase n=1 Tax=Microbacterium sp. zg.Y909 TaxID=2969413 RepID=UPI00214AD6EF|nr:glycosyltransferase [Microbacterium sp. zg.Y909]MCR2824243.1 glycosyltransferase [Microbacterium sp. zg.Y909]